VNIDVLIIMIQLHLGIRMMIHIRVVFLVIAHQEQNLKHFVVFHMVGRVILLGQ
jgi:hypothetical protein